jgi:uracil-DNA glycosylase family 4
MSKEIISETLAISRELKEQLLYYREIGVEDIGGSTMAAQRARAADSTSPASTLQPPAEASSQLQPQTALSSEIHDAASPLTAGEQPVLFGEAISPRINPAAQRASRAIADSTDVSLEAIRENLGDCRRCKLHEHRRTIVFGEGNPRARLVFVGEGPGAEEDATGRPFVGRAGQLLDKIIAAIGLKREDVYIANIVKCRPPGNRTPERDEVDTCQPFLFRQIAFINPLVIVALGSPAFQCLLTTREPITRARGQWRELNGIRVMPTFHPAFLLRSPDKKREVWEDMKKVRDYLNSRRDESPFKN